MKEHRWKNSWPGNWCLDCGIPEPIEDAMMEPDFWLDCGCCRPEDALPDDQCTECSGTGCYVNPKYVVGPGECGYRVIEE